MNQGQLSLRAVIGYFLLVPTVLLAALFTRIAPVFARRPDLSKINELFIPATAGGCAPKPAEMASYLAAVFVPPVLFFIFCRIAKRRFFLTSPDPQLRNATHRFGATLGIVLLQAIVGTVLWRSWFAQYDVERVFSHTEELVMFRFCAVALIVFSIRMTGRLFKWPIFARNIGVRVRRLVVREDFSLAVALVFIGLYSLTAIYTESIFPRAHPLVIGHYHHWVAEFEAVLLGKTPLVDVFPQYTILLGLLMLPVFKIFGIGVLAFTLSMTVLSAVGLLCIYFSLRNLTQSPLLALLLFLAFIGISEYLPLSGAFQYLALWPIRCFEPALAFYFLSRYLVRPSARRMTVLFFVASLVALNNLDFGMPAFVGVLAACLATVSDSVIPSWRDFRRVASSLLGAASVVFLGFVGICFLRSGHFPNLKYLYFYQSVFGVYGFNAVPTPHAGLHWALFLTYIGAVLWAIYLLELKSKSSEQMKAEVKLDAGMLLFSGIYGAGSFMYYVNRSLPPVLEGLFPVWGLCFAVLSWVLYRSARDTFAVNRLHSRLGYTWPDQVIYVIPFVLFVFAFGLCLANLKKMPTLADEIAKFSVNDPYFISRREAITQYLQSHTTSGEVILLMIRNPNGVLEPNHLVDVSLVPHPGAIFLKTQVKETMDSILSRGVKRVFGEEQYLVDFKELFRESGFVLKEAVNLKNAYAPLEYWERK